MIDPPRSLPLRLEPPPHEDDEGLALCCLYGLLAAYAPGELTVAGLGTEIVTALPAALHRALAYVAATLVDGRAVEIAARGCG